MRRGERPLDDNEEIVLELGLSDGETLAAATQRQGEEARGRPG